MNKLGAWTYGSYGFGALVKWFFVGFLIGILFLFLIARGVIFNAIPVCP